MATNLRSYEQLCHNYLASSSFSFGTTTAVDQDLPVLTSEVSLAFSDLLLP